MNRDLDLKIAEIKSYGVIDKNPDLLPHWSSALNMAWQLIGEMIKNGQDIRIEHDGSSDNWYFGYGSGNCGLTYVKGHTPQESICKGYLEWCDLTRKEN